MLTFATSNGVECVPQFFMPLGTRPRLFALLQAEVSTSYEVAFAAAADPDGNFFIGGYTDGNLDGFVNAGGEDFAVAKLSGVDGSVVWAWQVGAFVAWSWRRRQCFLLFVVVASL